MQKRRYRSVFANEGHSPIRTWEDFLEADPYCSAIGLFLNGRHIGNGQLYKLRKKGLKAVHTCSVWLKDEYRNQGHGLPLYFAMIRAACRIGADRIYSDYRLNKYSRRMWSEKLSAYFKVVKPRKPKCTRCNHCLRAARFYIEL